MTLCDIVATYRDKKKIEVPGGYNTQLEYLGLYAYMGSLNSIFLVEEGVDWGREDADIAQHDSPLSEKVLACELNMLSVCTTSGAYLLCNISIARRMYP